MSVGPDGSWDAIFRIFRLVQHLGDLLRTRVDLAKREVQQMARQFAMGAAFAGVGVLLLVLALPIVVVTVILALTIWLPAWAATGVVALALILVAGGLLFAARRKFAARRSGTPFVDGLRDDWNDIREKMERRS